MNICKRFISFLLSLLLVISVAGSAFETEVKAATTPILSAESKAVNAGEQFTIAVSLENATSVYGGNFTLQYDSDLLSIDTNSFEFGSIVSEHTKNCNTNYQSAGNLIRVTFSGASALSTSGTLITFTFTAKNNVSGTAALQFNAYKMYDENGSAITSTATDSAITIAAEPVVSPIISVTSKTVTVGETVSVPIVISDSEDVYGGNFTLQYDSDLLSIDTNSFEFGSIVSEHTKNCNTNYQSEGNLIRVTFSGAEAISSDGTLITFTFTAKTEGTATLKFNAYKMYDENGSAIDTNVSSGSVIVEPDELDDVVTGQCGDSAFYSYDIETCELTITGKGDMWDYTRSTDDEWSSFLYHNLIISAVIEEGITSIGNNVFERQAIENILIPQSVTTIGESAFFGSELTEVLIPGNVNKIGDSAFANCQSLTTVKLDEGVDSIAWGMFQNSALTEIEVPNSVVSVGEYAFAECKQLTDITISDGVKNIGAFAFCMCESLANVNMGIGVESISDYAFAYCSSLKEIIITNNVISIGIGAFSNCGLETLFIPDNVLSLGDECFFSNQSMTSAVIGNGIEVIGDSAFEGCDLESVTWGANIVCIGPDAFAGCSLTELSLPEKVSTIGSYAFLGNKISSVKIGGNVKEIGEAAFRGTYLWKVEIPRNVEKMGAYAFDETVLIYGYKNSVAEVYASTYGNDFIALDEVKVELVEIKKEPDKSTYYIGDVLDDSGLEIELTYNDGSTETITSGFITSGFDSTSVGTKTVTVSYEGFTDTFEVTVAEPTLTLSSSSKTLEEGSTATITATTTPSNQSVTWTSSNSSIAKVSNGTITAVAEGTTTITAKFTYNGITYSAKCNVTVTAKPVILEGITIAAEPSKSIYYVGDALDTTGLKLKLTYSDGTSETITSGFTASGFDSTFAGTKTVTVSYKGFTDTFNATVAEPTITLSSSSKTLEEGDSATIIATTTPSGQSITWTSSNSNVARVVNGTITAVAEGSAIITARFVYNGTTYNATCRVIVSATPILLEDVVITSEPTNNIYYIGEQLDTTGLKLKLTYSDGTSETITNGFTISGFDSLSVGRKTVTVSYEGFTDTFNVTVVEPTITLSSSNKTLEEGSAATITATTTPSGQSVTWTSSNSNVARVVNGTITAVAEGSAIITARFVYDGTTYSATCRVTVNAMPVTLENLTITQRPIKYTYYVGEELDTTGLCVLLNYSDGTWQTVTEGLTITGFDFNSVGEQTLSVWYNNMEAGTFTIEVIKKVCTHDICEWLDIVEGTCFHQGYREYVCVACEEVVATEYYLGEHNMQGEWIKVKESTCEERGKQEKYCLECGECVGEEYLPLDNHNVVFDREIEATCTIGGKTEGSHCGECGKVFVEQEEIPPYGHRFSEKTLSKKATKNHDGRYVQMCTNCGDKKYYTIDRISLVTLNLTQVTYNGKTQKVSVAVKDVNGKIIPSKYYTVVGNTGKNVGTYKVTIFFNGDYDGITTKEFQIVPKGTKLKKVKSDLRKITVKWKKQKKQIKGYQIQYSMDKKFGKDVKTITIKKANKTSKTISKLISKKKYYVRIRTYNGTCYSIWSKPKKVKVK